MFRQLVEYIHEISSNTRTAAFEEKNYLRKRTIDGVMEYS
jgi:hypothetical protein